MRKDVLSLSDNITTLREIGQISQNAGYTHLKKAAAVRIGFLGLQQDRVLGPVPNCRLDYSRIEFPRKHSPGSQFLKYITAVLREEPTGIFVPHAAGIDGATRMASRYI